MCGNERLPLKGVFESIKIEVTGCVLLYRIGFFIELQHFFSRVHLVNCYVFAGKNGSRVTPLAQDCVSDKNHNADLDLLFFKLHFQTHAEY